MSLVVMNLNDKNEQCQFDMSVIHEEVWDNLAQDIVFAKGKQVSGLGLKSAKVVIRNNKAKLKICFQDDLYHEHEYHLDVFGRASRNYSDLVSEMFQDIMEHYYGAEYKIALDNKIEEINQITKK